MRPTNSALLKKPTNGEIRGCSFYENGGKYEGNLILILFSKKPSVFPYRVHINSGLCYDADSCAPLKPRGSMLFFTDDPKSYSEKTVRAVEQNSSFEKKPLKNGKTHTITFLAGLFIIILTIIVRGLIYSFINTK